MNLDLAVRGNVSVDDRGDCDVSWEDEMEEPPFALPDVDGSPILSSREMPSIGRHRCDPEIDSLLPGLCAHASHVSSTSAPPTMVSSVVSEDSRTLSPQSYSSSLAGSLGTSAHSISSAALLGESSHLPHSRVLGRCEANSTRVDESAGFSRLMEAADNTNESLCQTKLPPLPEESAVTQQTVPSSTLSAPQIAGPAEPWSFPSFPFSRSAGTLISPPASEVNHGMSWHYIQSGLRATQLSDSSFRVSLDLRSPSSVRDVMDIVGNPDMLRLWCDSIQSLVITKTSEGALSATQRHADERGQRQYEGEWVEATTTALVPPKSHTTYLDKASNLVWSSLGFPSYGSVRMFVERQRGRVGINIGPFSGGINASHTITVGQNGSHVQVVDTVQLERHDGSSDSICGVDLLRWCWQPNVSAHMDQLLSSMDRLRALVEHGEAATSTVGLADCGPGTPLLG